RAGRMTLAATAVNEDARMHWLVRWEQARQPGQGEERRMHTRQSELEFLSACLPEARLSNVCRTLKGHAARLVFTAVFALAQLLGPLSTTAARAAPALEAPDSESSQQDFGTNVLIFDPSMSTATIQ